MKRDSFLHPRSVRFKIYLKDNGESTMEKDVISAVRSELRDAADEKTKIGFTRFFKEEALFYGVKSAQVGKIAAKYFPEIKPRGKKAVFRLCEELLKSDYSEESMIAFTWSYRLHKEFEEKDFTVFEGWLRQYVNNWAKCDTLCNHTIGSLVEKYPQYLEDLKRWTKSDNRWLKRAAAVTLIIPAKQGLFLDAIFEIADRLLLDKDDLVQKGYGWMLKEAAVKHQPEVFDYVLKNRAVMPRTALRYAIEKMPSALRIQAMSKP
jgi:3-methyladenine DNA glycosylase AlkD